MVSYLISNVFDPSITFEKNVFSTNTELSNVINSKENKYASSSQIYNNYLIKDLNLQIEILSLLNNNETLNFPKKMKIGLRSSSEIFNEVFKILPDALQNKQYNKVRLNITKPKFFNTIENIPFYLSSYIIEYLYFLVEMIIRTYDKPLNEKEITKLSEDLIQIYGDRQEVDFDYISKVIGYINNLYKKAGYKINDDFWDTITKELQFILKMQDYEEFNFDNNGILTIDINDEKDMINIVKNIFTNQSIVKIFKISWEKQSSGQIAIIKLLGNIHKAFEEIRIKDIGDNSTNIMLLIDEIDLYFHPQWQKRALLTINHAIHEMVRKMPIINKEIDLQVVFTTHSPFLVSDLTAERVLFLEFNSNSEVVAIDNLEGIKRTFGSNIHELYAHSFFLKGGLMGEFAKQKINNIANEIISYMPNQNQMIDWESIRRQINIVGEPILRSRLIELYNEKRTLVKPLPDEMVTLKQELEDLQKEMKKVQKRILDFEKKGDK